MSGEREKSGRPGGRFQRLRTKSWANAMVVRVGVCLTGEEKRVILRDAGGGKPKFGDWVKERLIYSGFTFVIHEVQSRRGWTWECKA